MSFLYTHSYNVPNSSLIDVIYYDVTDRNLGIKFKTGGRSAYRNVPAAIVRNFASAASPGQFYNQNIRGQYDGLVMDGHFEPKTLASGGVIANSINDNNVATNVDKRKFFVRGTVSVEREYEATTVDEALQKFHEEFSDAKTRLVHEAGIRFDNE